jgi:hypothetical protein
MLEFLPQELREGFALAQSRRARRSRLRVQLGEAVFPVLSLSEEAMVLDAAKVPRLRGMVAVYDGARSNRVSETPPLDYPRDENAPSGYLPWR